MGVIRSYPMWVKMIVLLISVSIITTPLMAEPTEAQQGTLQDQQGGSDFSQICPQAELDAETDESGAIGYGVGGFLCGIFGWLFAILSKPKAPAERLVGKDADYVMAYSSCYEKKAKSIRQKAACTGWAIGAAVSLVIISASGGSSTSN